MQTEFAHIYTLKLAGIVPYVFNLANEGDQVCIDMLIDLGNSMGEIMGMMINSLGTQALPQDIVTAGGPAQRGKSIADGLVRPHVSQICSLRTI